MNAKMVFVKRKKVKVVGDLFMERMRERWLGRS